MDTLTWLAPSSDGAATSRRRTERTERASAHLHLLARRVAPHGIHLALHEAVDLAFGLEAHHLPAGTADLRQGDALAHALVDPTALLVTAGGIFIGQPITADPRWRELGATGRSRASLGSSALSGAYLGLSVEGPHAIRYH